MQISFAQRDTALRNQIHATLTASLRRLRAGVLRFKKFGISLERYLSLEDYERLERVVAIIELKATRASLYLSMHDPEHALFQVRNVHEDVTLAMDRLEAAEARLHPRVECRVDHGVWLDAKGVLTSLFGRKEGLSVWDTLLRLVWLFPSCSFSSLPQRGPVEHGSWSRAGSGRMKMRTLRMGDHLRQGERAQGRGLGCIRHRKQCRFP